MVMGINHFSIPTALSRLPSRTRREGGFTIVELTIVIIIIGILAAIVIVNYNGLTGQAKTASAKSSLVQLRDAIELAEANTHEPLIDIINQVYTASACVNEPAGTDFATLPKSDPCWTDYQTALGLISDASGTDVNNLVDPWGRPFYIDANEWEWDIPTQTHKCGHDYITTFSRPYGGSSDRVDHDNDILLPFSTYTDCE